jgi:hypothetical protein
MPSAVNRRTPYPVVSVVMSVFNGERFLREAVESILYQSFSDFEFIIVDDGSTDQSYAILDSYKKSDNRIRIHSQENRGSALSLNQGCHLANGKYIARMDADDIAMKDRLALQVEFMEANPLVGILGGAAEWIDAAGNPLGVHRHPAEDAQIKEAMLHHCAFWHPTVLMRTQVFTWSGGYRPMVFDAEDYDLWLRAAERFQLANLSQILIKYRIHPNQVSIQKNRQQTMGILAARAAAKARRMGKPDPLIESQKITSVTLVELGIDKVTQEKEFAFRSWLWVRAMYTSGEYSAATRVAVEVLRSSESYLGSWQLSEWYLILGKLCWRQNDHAKGLLFMCRALLARPMLLGRPLKQWLQRVRPSKTNVIADSPEKLCKSE